MLQATEPFGRRCRGTLGNAAVNDVIANEFTDDIGNVTPPLPRNIVADEVLRFLAMRQPEASSVLAGRAWSIGASNVVRRVRPPATRLLSLFDLLLNGTGGEGIDHSMRIDGVNFIAKLPTGAPLPEIEFGHEEITFEWRGGELSAVASVEGDGLVGYALKKGERYVPGDGPEDIDTAGLPEDLSEYLERIRNEI